MDHNVAAEASSVDEGTQQPSPSGPRIPFGLELVFETNLTSADAKVIWLATYFRDGDRWRKAAWRDWLGDDDLALCNLETWPELRNMESVFSLVEPYLKTLHVWCPNPYGPFSALQLRPLADDGDAKLSSTTGDSNSNGMNKENGK